MKVVANPKRCLNCGRPVYHNGFCLTCHCPRDPEQAEVWLWMRKNRPPRAVRREARGRRVRAFLIGSGIVILVVLLYLFVLMLCGSVEMTWTAGKAA